MNNKKILIIGLVWPEPSSSAAGTRMLQLINAFIANDFKVFFASAAAKGAYSANLEILGVEERAISLNDQSFNAFLQDINPDMVMFDRFMIEEQYGWRVSQECPETLKILDTEDLHFLRHARQQAFKAGRALATADLYSDMAKREIAAIMRCDLSLIISALEMEILAHHFRVPKEILQYLPFTEQEIDECSKSSWQNFEEREGFVFIGNYLHEPNWQTVQILKTQIWPVLRKKLPGVKLHIYGAYSTQKVMQLHQPKEHFYVHGRAADAKQAIGQHRILLAPIKFGAGLKGKFIDAMHSGTPVMTTAVGAEAMHGDLDWNGAIADDMEDFITQACNYYNDEKLWLAAQQKGITLLNTLFSNPQVIPSFINTLHILSKDLAKHRQNNFFGQILQQQNASSTKYMSLWIEEKNRNK